MSIFGQVWLWSAAAFLLGVLLTWVFLVRPAQARSTALERRLQAARAQPAQERRAPVRTFEREETPEPVRAAPVAEAMPEPAWHERATPPDSVSSVLEPELANERTSIFRPQETAMFTPPAVPFNPPEAPPRHEQEEPHPSTQDEPAQPYALEEPREPERGSLFDPSYEPPAQPPQAYAFSDEAASTDEHAEDVTHLLPRRQPRTSPAGGFEPPQPIQPSMRPMERREPADAGGRSGSLFEPVIRPNSGGAHAAPEPPPARSHAAGSDVPVGPFGPGSAMPMPGGASPADDFTVKASVTALRYCTADSPQFPRMVAEVWFRSAEDAERVGFRPLT